MISFRRVIAVMVVLLSILMVPVGVADAQGCTEKCVRENDRGYCSSPGGFGRGRNCQEYSQCTIYAVDADGAGPGSPQIIVTCTYSCTIEHCSWV